MREPVVRSIRGRLLALVVAVAVPLLVVLVWSFWEKLQREHRDARELALRIARVFAAEVGEETERSTALLERMAARAESGDRRSGDCDALFAIVDFFPDYLNLVLFDRAGELVCSATPQPSDAAVARVANQRIRDRIQDDPDPGEDPALLLIDGRWVMVNFHEALSGEGSAGVLALVQAFELGVESFPAGTVVTIVDADGVVVARSSDAAAWVDRSIGDTEIGRLTSTRPEGRAEARGVDGELRQYGFATVPGVGWRVFVGVPAGVAMAAVRSLMFRGAMAGLAAIVVVILVAVWISRTIERPLDSLAGAAERIAREGYGSSVPDDGPAEVAALARSFNTMVEHRSRAEGALVESRTQLEALSKRLLEVQEDERRRISSEIHDELGQAVTALKMDVGGLVQTMEAMTPEQRLLADRILRELDGTIDSVQRIASELRPPVLDDFGLEAAIETDVRLFESRTGIECDLSVAHDGLRLDPAIEVVVYRIVQEAMTNVARHSDATRVEIRLRRRGDDMILEIRDDGVGIRREQVTARGSLGIAGMRERARRVGGELEVEGLPDSGTIVSLRLPLTPREVQVS
jgi:signal transduction histidine kinase